MWTTAGSSSKTKQSCYGRERESPCPVRSGVPFDAGAGNKRHSCRDLGSGGQWMSGLLGRRRRRAFLCLWAGKDANADNLLHQALLWSDPDTRIEVVIRLYQMRFDEPLPDTWDLRQIRGREGIRVREAYASSFPRDRRPWTGRSYDRTNWAASDPVNRALSAANSCLYGICQAAILALGLSPAIGFIHTGKMLSFVYDVADLYKADVSIPIAFSMVAGARNTLRHERGKRLGTRSKRICF